MTDFKDWIEAVELEDFNDVYCLYKSVEQLEEWGAFSTTQRMTSKGNIYFVKCSYIDDILMLASNKAKDYFIKNLEEVYAGDMTMEGWYYYKQQMEKDD